MTSSTAAGSYPLLDPTILLDLEEQLSDQAITRSFIRDYAQARADRHRRLADAIAHEDRDASLEAVLSIKTAALMVGGVRLAQLASDLEEVVRGGEMDRAIWVLPELRKCGKQTVKELLNLYTPD